MSPVNLWYTKDVKPGLIIFDLDGTLIDSLGDITVALNWAFRPLGIKEYTPTEVSGMVGEGTLRLVEKALEKRNATGDKKGLMENLLTYYAVHPIDHTLPYPGVPETLEKLSRYRKAIVSNKAESITRKILDALGWAGHFDMVVGADTIVERKPAPGPILHVLLTLAMQQEEAVMVGDSDIDIEAARAASIRTVATTYGYGKRGYHEKADFHIDRFPQLIEILATLERCDNRIVPAG